MDTLELTEAETPDLAPMQWPAPYAAGAVLVYAHHAHLLEALGRGEFEDAYQYAASITPPGMLSPWVRPAVWVTLDLVEAAVRTHRGAEAAAHVNAMRTANVAALSTRFALLVGASEAVAARDDESAIRRFVDTLAIPGIDRLPFDLARVRLLYGERLRRARATTASREQLSAAFEAFERLGAMPWMHRCAIELRAAGQPLSEAGESSPWTLTPQEREIAMLAASGLTNKQIARRLFLSHRTVGAHLYRVFPKLGITSRAALRDALDAAA